MSVLPVLPLVLLLVGAVLALLVGMWRTSAAQAVAVAATTAAAVAAVAGLVAVVGPEGQVLVHQLGGWPAPIGIEYVLDPLSAYMLVVITVVGLLVAAYPAVAGYGQDPRAPSTLFTLVLLVLVGLTGVAVSGDLFHLFVFLEVYALASYALVAQGGTPGVLAAFRYLLIGTAGASVYLLGVGFVYFATGTLSMDQAGELLPGLASSPAIAGGLALMIVGLSVKMALFPLHVWLPAAHSAAPPAVAALLAAVQLKVGAYALLRIVLEVFGPTFIGGPLPLTTLLAWFGAAGVLVGSVAAIRQRDLKRMLAYSTVAQIGFIGIGIGLATPLAIVGALLHVAAHALMKSALFFVAGGILAETGIKEIRRFSGLGRRMPVTMVGFTVAAASMVGIPPTAGFFSKWYLIRGSVEAGSWGLAAIIAGSSLLTAVYVVRLVEQLFTREPVEEVVAQAHDAGSRIVVPIGVLAGGILVLGFGNVALVTGVLEPIAAQLLS